MSDIAILQQLTRTLVTVLLRSDTIQAKWAKSRKPSFHRCWCHFVRDV